MASTEQYHRVVIPAPLLRDISKLNQAIFSGHGALHISSEDARRDEYCLKMGMDLFGGMVKVEVSVIHNGHCQMTVKGADKNKFGDSLGLFFSDELDIITDDYEFRQWTLEELRLFAEEKLVDALQEKAEKERGL